MFLSGKNLKSSFPSTEQKTNFSAESVVSQSSAVVKALTSSGQEEFKLTQDIIITALTDHLLEDFIVSHDSLNILETLGEGEIYS